MPSGYYVRTIKYREKMRAIALEKGYGQWMNGRILPHISKRNSEAVEEKALRWLGDKVGYRALHCWVIRKLGKAKKCSVCGREGNGREIHWANIDHKYRRKVEDYIELCMKCHAEYDKKNGLRKHKHLKN